MGGELKFASISAGWRFSCGVTTDGEAYCWGRGEWGQLGDGLATLSSVPTGVAGGHEFRKLDVGSNNLVCGLTTAGRILCWGLDVAGHGTLALIKAARANKGLLKMSWRTAIAPMRRNASVSRVYGGRDRVYQRLIAPLCTAIMNAAPEETAARAFLTVMGTLALGGQDAIRPFVARDNLAPALIDPALAAIERLGGEVRFHDPLLVIEPRDGTIIAAQFRSGTAALGPDHALVLALPPWALDMLPAASPAPAYVARAILCAHYAVPPGMGFPDNARMMGIIGGTTQWMTLAKSTLSVTVSAAETLMDRDAGEIAEMLWREVSAALGRRGTPVPPWRVIKERRATADVAGQYGPRSQYHNLFIAGGWTDGRYPDTIEAAVASGRRAANCLAQPKQ